MAHKTRSTVATKAAEIRKALKAIGYTSKHVSVRSESYSMGSSINIKIKRDGVNRAEVERIANTGSRVHYCESSGEILSGGNRFVFVDVDDSACAVYSAAYLPRIAALKDEGNGGDSCECGDVIVTLCNREYRILARSKSGSLRMVGCGFDARSAAHQAAVNIACGPSLRDASVLES